MALKDINFNEEYRSDEGNVVRDFYIPALNTSSLYRRAVGYFTSNSIALASQGIVALIKNGGRMQLIASPYLTEADVQAITSGYRSREQVVVSCISNQIPPAVSDIPTSNQWECLAWMIANGTLDIMIALPHKEHLSGLFHEKLGIFSDGTSDVAFSGSANETAGGLLDNFETIDVFTSWRDTSRVHRKIANFEKLWANTTTQLEVIDFPEACRAKLLSHLPISEPSFPPAGSKHPLTSSVFSIPSKLKLRDYQETAITNWFHNRCRGILQMATGAGKTVTGLAAAQKLFASGNLEALVIVCPFTHLVSQWNKECHAFNLQPVLAFRSSDSWLAHLNASLTTHSDIKNRPVTVITTVATFASTKFQSRIKHFPSRTLVLADEVHNMGASTIRTSLPENIPFRLGLSATPERWFDNDGTHALYDYFGDVLKPIFTLRDAIKCGALCKYSYHPILVELTDDESTEYRNLSRRIAQFASADDTRNPGPLDALLIKRARLVATASGKTAALVTLMEKRNAFTHHLFYCGDGTLQDDDGNIVKHVDDIIQLLSRQLNARVAKFTSECSVEERNVLLAAFNSGDLQGLVAIRCLDEGVDVPSTQTAVILASSTNPRQFIQRRGRILRPSPGKERAQIFDMIVYPPPSGNVTPSERALARKELIRYTEFARLADNAPEAKKILWKLQEYFHLTDM